MVKFDQKILNIEPKFHNAFVRRYGQQKISCVIFQFADKINIAAKLLFNDLFHRQIGYGQRKPVQCSFDLKDLRIVVFRLVRVVELPIFIPELEVKIIGAVRRDLNGIVYILARQRFDCKGIRLSPQQRNAAAFRIAVIPLILKNNVKLSKVKIFCLLKPAWNTYFAKGSQKLIIA